MVATPVAPALSRTVTVSVCGPFGVSVVTHGSVTCVADWLSDQTVAPARSEENRVGGGEAAVILAGLVAVASDAGAVKGAVSGGGGEPPQFCTMTFTEAVPVAPAASRTVTVRVCGPSGVFEVTHGSVTCVADWLSDHTVAPA